MTLTKTLELPVITVKRSISPDGRIDAVSFYAEYPVQLDDLTATADQLRNVAELVETLTKEWQARRLREIMTEQPASVAPPTNAPGQSKVDNASTDAKSPTGASNANADANLRAVVTKVRWVDKVESKYSKNGQYCVKFTIGDAPPLYIDTDKLESLLPQFKVKKPFDLKGIAVRAFVDDEKKRTRRIEPATDVPF